MPPDHDVLNLLDAQLGRYQGIISRLAGNSVQVKTWCFTATAALAALAVDRDSPEMFGVALILAAAFFYLDSYYLALEQRFRDASSQLAERVISGEEIDPRELVIITSPRGSLTWQIILRCGGSSQTAIIYVVVAVALMAGLLAAVL